MTWLRNMPIRGKVTLLILSTSTAALLVACTAFVRYEMFASRRAMARDLMVLADVLGRNSTAALKFDDPSAAKNILEALQAKPHVTAACLYTLDGQRFAEYVRPGTRAEFPAHADEGTYQFERDHLAMFRPIILDRKTIGTVYLQSDLADIDERLQSFVRIAAVVLLGSTGLTAAISFWLQRLISQPILDLATTAQAIRENKDYSVRAPGHGRDEIGLLTNSFNEMLGQIQVQNDALRRAHDDLDRRVQERTIALSAWTQALNQFAIVAETDTEGRIIYANDPFCKISKYSREELLGKDHRDVVNSGFHSKEFWKEMWSTIGRGQIWRGEIKNRAKDGSIYWVDTVIVPQLGASGKPDKYLAIRFVITQRKEAEQMRLDFCRALFESLPGLYLVLTPDLKIVAVSDAYLKATMSKRDGILGRGIFEAFPDNPNDPTADGASNLRGSLNRVLQGGVADTMAIQRYDVRRPDGVFEERFWSPVNSPVFGVDRTIEYIIHRVEDVTDFIKQREQTATDKDGTTKRMEQMEAEVFRSSQEVKAANNKLRAANQELEAFCYSVSHDLRAPLRGLDGFSQALLEDYGENLDATGKHLLERIRTASRRMDRLIDDLLNLSRVSRGELSREPVDLSGIARDVFDELHRQSPHRHVDLRVADDLKTEGDPRLLRVMLENLLGNAWKYTTKKPEATIEFGVNGDNGQPSFFVRDDGVGFDMQYVGKLFAPFQRLHGMNEFPGTGIGLATVQRIISRHGGRVWVEAEVNKGATFHFTLS